MRFMVLESSAEVFLVAESEHLKMGGIDPVPTEVYDAYRYARVWCSHCCIKCKHRE